MSTNPFYRGDRFDDFLCEQDVREEVHALVIKRELAAELRALMRFQQVSKAELARRMQTSRSALDRLLDADNTAVTLRTLEKAARAVGRQLQIRLSDAA
jgi:predicted XRE-type DNA-binding protein